MQPRRFTAAAATAARTVGQGSARVPPAPLSAKRTTRLPDSAKFVCLDALQRGPNSKRDAELDRQLEAVLLPLTESPEETEKKRKVLSMLREVLASEFPRSSLQEFGSSRSGLALSGSDLDVHCELGNGKTPKKQVHTLARFLERNHFKLLMTLPFARVPLLKLFVKTAPREGVRVDFAFHGVGGNLGVHNSDLIRCYANLDPRVAPLIRLVKIWAKTQGVGDASLGFLSSYSWTLLVISYLQHLPPSLGSPILPNLQSPKLALDVDLAVGPYRVAYCSSLRPTEVPSSTSLGTLLRLFFAHIVAWPWESKAVSISESQVPKPESLAPWSLAILDPFETDRNLGNTITGGPAGAKHRCEAILGKAYDAFHVLESGDDDDEVRRSLFGSLPDKRQMRKRNRTEARLLNVTP